MNKIWILWWVNGFEASIFCQALWAVKIFIKIVYIFIISQWLFSTKSYASRHQQLPKWISHSESTGWSCFQILGWCSPLNLHSEESLKRVSSRIQHKWLNNATPQTNSSSCLWQFYSSMEKSEFARSLHKHP
jgi:hypothetical protein